MIRSACVECHATDGEHHFGCESSPASITARAARIATLAVAAVFADPANWPEVEGYDYDYDQAGRRRWYKVAR